MKNQLSIARENLAVAQAATAHAHASSSGAAAVVAKSQAALDAARTEVARAEREFETAGDKAWPAVESARRAYLQHELRLAQAEARADAAAAKYIDAQLAVQRAQSALDAAEQVERRKRIDELVVASGDLLIQMQTNLVEMENELGGGLPQLDWPALRMHFFEAMRLALQRVDVSIRDGRSIVGWLRQ